MTIGVVILGLSAATVADAASPGLVTNYVDCVGQSFFSAPTGSTALLYNRSADGVDLIASATPNAGLTISTPSSTLLIAKNSRSEQAKYQCHRHGRDTVVVPGATERMNFVASLSDANDRADLNLGVEHAYTSAGVYGGPGNDELIGTPGTDELVGGSGNDIIRANGGTDNIDAGSGDDQIILSPTNTSATSIDCGTGNDTVVLNGAPKPLHLVSCEQIVR